MTGISLLAGPDPLGGAENAASHLSRLGPLPVPGPGLIPALERSDLRGRGGAAFPVGRKWRSVAERRGGSPVVLVNGAEGEPLSRKDRVLMEARPHLVLDGAALAAAAVGAGEVVLYVGSDHGAAAVALRQALGERPEAERRRIRLVDAPARYVAGEETAAVHFVNDGVALPVSAPPRPYERGVGGRPTLVQNVESLAHVAMIARFGDQWFRGLGDRGSSGTVLLTLCGAVRRPGVHEVAQGTLLGQVIDGAGGGPADPASAVLLGGYFGGWLTAAEARILPLDPAALRDRGHTLGCGVVAVLPEHRCGVVETAGILAYLADQSARQCGPCVFGLRAIAAAVGRVASGAPETADLDRIRRWSGELSGRGACHHPDGAAGLLLSALRTFAEEFRHHHELRRCSAAALREAA
ncbi:MAG TPA: NADH-ubiquinone oxidoreductase-F iron-sulfur binding region domain-containing protein [Candidatus Dormibacteraeota bacterium]|nr:NADH-ubiquinone oxidoreductase-F iron-sulfur binding region domain-containing protein [Candidatus Dormibacteraeota bacterium]